MKLIIGLGNPEERYKYSRHNTGFLVIDRLVKQFTVGPKVSFPLIKKFKALVLEKQIGGEQIFLVKPQTYMNNSGWTVELMAKDYQIEPEDIWVIHDDIDLPLGKLRIRSGGGSGGHNGIESIIRHLNTDDFIRFRLGIGRGKLDEKKSMLRNLHRRMVTEFVLSPFSKSEKGAARKMIKQAEKAILLALEKGIKQAMNRYN